MLKRFQCHLILFSLSKRLCFLKTFILKLYHTISVLRTHYDIWWWRRKLNGGSWIEGSHKNGIFAIYQESKIFKIIYRHRTKLGTKAILLIWYWTWFSTQIYEGKLFWDNLYTEVSVQFRLILNFKVNVVLDMTVTHDAASVSSASHLFSHAV